MLIYKKHFIIFLLIIPLVALVYFKTLHAQFQFDDYHQVVKNPAVRQLGNIPKFFVTVGLGSQHQWGRGYRPITYSSFALNYAISKNNPWSYHALNLLLHIINSLLVYLVLMRMLGSAGEGGMGGRAGLLSGAAALIFALHPVQTNAVTYVSGRAVLLAAMFGLASFYSFLRWRESRKGAPWAAFATTFFILALLSKEIAVAVPVMMFLHVIIFPERERSAVKSLVIFAPLALSLIGYLIVKKIITGIAVSAPSSYGRFEYLLSEAKAVVLYMRLTLLPMNQNADYALPLTKSLDAGSAFSILLIAGFVAVLLKVRRIMPLVSFFGLWAFIALAPEALIVPITDIAVEYRMYLASAGFIAAGVLLADRYVMDKKVLGASFIAVILLLSVLTAARNEVWATERTLWADVIGKSPNSFRAYTNYGNALYREGRYGEAVAVLTRAHSMDPGDPDQVYTLNNLGSCFIKLGLYAEAEGALKAALLLEPEIEEPYLNLAGLYHGQKRYTEEADVLRMLLDEVPGSVSGRSRLAAVEKLMRSR